MQYSLKLKEKQNIKTRTTQDPKVHKVKRFYENATQVSTNILFYNFFYNL